MDRISRNFTIGKKKMEYLSSEHVHKKFNMNVMFLFLIEVHISPICDSDVLYDLEFRLFDWRQKNFEKIN